MDLAVLRTTARGLVALAVAGCVASAHAASPYVVGNYPVDATATDAVAAKAQGMADAQKGALRYLMKRLVDVSAYRQLPQLAPAVRVVVCGRAQTPSIDAVLALFDRAQVLERLRPPSN